jgi:hypothetical protein
LRGAPTMGEILGLGMSHFPGMRNPGGSPTNLERMLQRPDIPAEWKDPANWPEGLQKEWGNDKGQAAAARQREQFIKNCRVLREHLDRFNPDFVLIWGDDQYENFKEDIIPPFCIFAWEDRDIYPYHPERERLDPNRQTSALAQPEGMPPPPNAWGEPYDTVFHIRGKREAAKYLTRGLIEEKIDMAYAYEPLHFEGLSHAFLNAAMFLDWDRKGWDYPTIPMQVNCYGSRVIVNRGGAYPVGKPFDLPEGDIDPPGPSPERCMEVGAAVARVLKRSPWRTAVIASSSWSHAFLVPKHWFIYPDVEADRKLYDALVKGDFDYWRSIPNHEVEQRGHQEVRNWWCLMGAMEELGQKGPAYHDYIESYTMNSNKCFAAYDPLCVRPLCVCLASASRKLLP